MTIYLFLIDNYSKFIQEITSCFEYIKYLCNQNNHEFLQQTIDILILVYSSPTETDFNSTFFLYLFMLPSSYYSFNKYNLLDI